MDVASEALGKRVLATQFLKDWIGLCYAFLPFTVFSHLQNLKFWQAGAAENNNTRPIQRSVRDGPKLHVDDSVTWRFLCVTHKLLGLHRLLFKRTMRRINSWRACYEVLSSCHVSVSKVCKSITVAWDKVPMPNVDCSCCMFVII